MPKINTFFKSSKYLWAALIVAASFLVFSGISYAQSVLQGYASDEKLQRGMLVAQKPDDETKVIALTAENADKFKGVVAEQNDSPVTISSEERNIFVATVGPYQMLVTDENGPIKKGEYIGISSAAGLGTRAADYHTYVYGVAAQDFAGGGDAVSSTQVDGREVKVGRILVDISFGKNPFSRDPNQNKVPEILKRISESIADKPVSNVRVFIGLAIFIATAIITGTMLFSGIRSAVISIGRNPLSKVSIYRGIIQVVLFALIIFIAGIFGVYLVLKL